MRIVEIAIYSILNFLPLAILALYTFRRMLRLSLPMTAAIVGLLTVLQVITGVCVVLVPGKFTSLLSLSSTVLYFAFFVAAVKARFGKILFMLIMLSNVANYFVMLSKCLEGLIFPDLAMQDYRWSFSLMMLVVQLVLIPPLFLYLKRVISPTVEITRADSIWRFVWVVPVIFYFIWYYWLYSGVERTSLEIALRPANSVALMLVNAGALMVYYVVAMLIVEFDRNRQLQEQNHQLSICEMQYKNLQERIMETRQARHDLRHHITLMSSYVKNGEYDRLADYLREYEQSMPNTESILFCDNAAVNTLLLYFATKAKERDIDFSVSAKIPADLWVAETDLSVILGNLLENAIDAAGLYENAQIIVRLDAQPMMLLIGVDNTFHGEFTQSENGIQPSTKHPGEGLGLRSVQSIVEKYNGKLKLEAKDGLFYASALLNKPQE